MVVNITSICGIAEPVQTGRGTVVPVAFKRSAPEVVNPS